MDSETVICRDCGNYVPLRNAVKGPDLDGTVVCVECSDQTSMDSWSGF